MVTGDHPANEEEDNETHPKPPSNDLESSSNEKPSKIKTWQSLTLRGICLAIILNILYTLINAYLGMNFGIGMGFSIITVLAAYTLFQYFGGGTNRQELTTTMVASTGFTIYYTISISIYIQAYVPGANLPFWLVPSYDILMTGSPFHPAWFIPICFHLGFVLTSTMLGFITALAVSDLVLSRKKVTFPFYLASGVTINTCLETDQKSRFMFQWLGIGIILTLTQYFINLLVMPFGLTAVSWDFTPLLPTGFALGFMLNISLMAVSYIIDPRLSLTMLFAGIINYLVLSPILTTYGIITPGITGMDHYFNLLFQFSLSPALGIMLISGIIILGIQKLRKNAKANEKSNPNVSDALGFGEYTKRLFTGLRKKPKLLAAFLSIIGIFIIIVSILNIFSPFPIWISVPLTLILLVGVAIIDVFILIKFVGEAGIGIGVQRLAFYEIPLATSGLYGYVPFLAYPAINPWTTTDTIGNLKIGQLTKTPKKPLLVAQLLKILPGSITSVVFVLAAWYFIGFPSETFPAIGVLQGFAIVSLFATRSLGTSFNLVTFFLGGIIVGLLAAFQPVSYVGAALALFLPPSYFIPFSFGGFLRLYTQKKY
ncbi:MAG: OPT/YSL family transporter, partial [Promethearchaeota archaeon]